MSRHQQMLSLLQQTFPHARIELRDVSAEHHGHAGHDPQGSHFRLTMVDPLFGGRTPLQRHRLVYDCLRDMLLREVHALQLELLAPGETPRQP